MAFPDSQEGICPQLAIYHKSKITMWLKNEAIILKTIHHREITDVIFNNN
ncbi:MAG: hypothetical protein MJE68_31430 [Proteobacteria bacterium]|nr:hypothetical protein [Pseudomonadota bacterium]